MRLVFIVCMIISASICRVGHKCDMTRALYCNGQGSLMLCTVARDPSRKYLSSLGHILLERCNIFVIQSLFLATENADLLTSVHRVSSSYGCIPSIIVALWFTKSHFFLLSALSNVARPFGSDFVERPRGAARVPPLRGPPYLHQLNGSSSSIPSGMFMKPSPASDPSAPSGAAPAN